MNLRKDRIEFTDNTLWKRVNKYERDLKDFKMTIYNRQR